MIAIRKLLAAGCAAAPMLAAATGLPAGTVLNAGLAWQLPDGVLRAPSDAAVFCGASSAGGLSDWRLPTALELTNLYYDLGIKLAGSGWPSNWIYTSDPYTTGNKVARVTDGSWSYAATPQAVTCVHTAATPPAPAPENGPRSKLIWEHSGSQAMSWEDAGSFCGARNMRLPTTVELSNQYYENGASYLAGQGWPSDWIWTATPYNTGHQVVRLVDGLPSWGTGGPYAAACVAEPSGLPANTLTSNGLVFLAPDSGARDLSSAEAMCSASAAGGLNDWRLPNVTELSDLYYNQGPAALAGAGWPTDWTWTSTPFNGYNKVVRMTDGLVSYGAAAYASTCVHSAPSASPQQPPADTPMVSGGLAWSVPAAMKRPYTNTIGYCAAATIAGQQGWRLPTAEELIALHADRGGAALAAAGWPADWVWTSSAYGAGYKVVRTSDGVASWAGWGDTERYHLTCVKDSSQLSVGGGSAGSVLVNGSLTYSRPAALARPWANTAGFCSANIQGQEGWRLPSRAELLALYEARGANALEQAGWPSGWMWTGDAHGTSGYEVVRMSDGGGSWSDMADSSRQFASCVKESEGLPPGTVTDNGMTWLRPPVLPRPWTNTEGYCSAQRAGGHADWRLPTEPELMGLYANTGWSALAAAGWPTDFVWSATPYSSGWKVVKLSTGGGSWAGDDNASRYYPVCVR